MNNGFAKSRQEPVITTTASDSDAPLWLLQKDDTSFLYVSLFLSVTVHIILFAVMAATRIFHPFTGSTQEFDLVWLSPAGMTAPPKPATSYPAELKKITEKFTRSIPAATPTPANTPKAKTDSSPPPSAEIKSPPMPPAPTAAPATGVIQTAEEAPIEEAAELTISRFSGKVVEVVDKQVENPAFSVMSSVEMKSKNARTVVQSIRETEGEANKPLKTRRNVPQPKDNAAATQPTKELTGKPVTKVAVVTASASQSNKPRTTAQESAIQRKVSSAAVTPAGSKTVTLPAVNRSINSFAAALNTLAAAGNKQTAQAQAQAPRKELNGLSGSAQASSLQSPAKPATPTRPPVTVKPAPQEEKQTSQTPPPPQIVLHPPVTGDLKLIITGDIDVKVEVFFKPFPKGRRGKPFTRWEAENRRNIIPKLVRTQEKVHEAVVEITDEGIYSIMVRVNNGKSGTAGLTLKIRESRPGGRAKDLGARKIDGSVEVAKVLMPEGVLWNDDGYFTGDMEDADSVTKFNSETGLMWREYK